MAHTYYSSSLARRQQQQYICFSIRARECDRSGYPRSAKGVVCEYGSDWCAPPDQVVSSAVTRDHRSTSSFVLYVYLVENMDSSYVIYPFNYLIITLVSSSTSLFYDSSPSLSPELIWEMLHLPIAYARRLGRTRRMNKRTCST